ncbi:hypothetical protein [Parafrankia sp. BMG5.11]|uniref:hypothetical protein n=1 Tax=Parafrankia sp. BMG5.11 TaxID=222540 RepID=UPI001A9D1F77|nr:hypothetical protein [Parafrankia sp. BMG5.11]CAI7976452.1 conserved hypothetical protein [Frankia sp. Hr75.2]
MGVWPRLDEFQVFDHEIRRLRRARSLRGERISRAALLRVAIDLAAAQAGRDDIENLQRRSSDHPDSGWSEDR